MVHELLRIASEIVIESLTASKSRARAWRQHARDLRVWADACDQISQQSEEGKDEV
jgi:hypothetical protein